MSAKCHCEQNWGFYPSLRGNLPHYRQLYGSLLRPTAEKPSALGLAMTVRPDMDH
jgi:hypothetical protein